MTGKQPSGGRNLVLFCIDLTNLDLNCNNFFPINGTQTNLFLGATACTFLSMNIFKKSFDTNANKVIRINVEM